MEQLKQVLLDDIVNFGCIPSLLFFFGLIVLPTLLVVGSIIEKLISNACP